MIFLGIGLLALAVILTIFYCFFEKKRKKKVETYLEKWY